MRTGGWATVTVAAITMSLWWTLSDAAEPQPSSGQSQLDMIAAIPLDQAFKEGGASLPTGPFTSWTPDQQRSVPTNMERFCTGFWTFINGADEPQKARLLPASVPGADEIRLVVDVCLLTHLPADWPERGARLQSAKSILNKADQAGASLHLPAQPAR